MVIRITLYIGVQRSLDPSITKKRMIYNFNNIKNNFINIKNYQNINSCNVNWNKKWNILPILINEYNKLLQKWFRDAYSKINSSISTHRNAKRTNNSLTLFPRNRRSSPLPVAWKSRLRCRNSSIGRGHGHRIELTARGVLHSITRRPRQPPSREGPGIIKIIIPFVKDWRRNEAASTRGQRLKDLRGS